MVVVDVLLSNQEFRLEYKHNIFFCVQGMHESLTCNRYNKNVHNTVFAIFQYKY